MVAHGGVLLERQDELRAIERQLAQARAGEGSALIVEGQAGIGKTTLLRAAIERAQTAGTSVLRARGGVLERHLEYGVVRQLLERPLVKAGAARRAELFAGPAAPAAAVLGLGELPVDAGPGHDPSAGILHGLHWLIANLADAGSLLIVIDDAHWADAASLRTAGYLARRLDGLPVALLLGTRDDEPGSQAALLTELLHASEPAYLRPAPLAEAAVAQVLRDAFAGQQPSAPLVAACTHASGGNPFFLTELATELAAAHATPDQLAPDLVERIGPLAVQRSLLLRLGRLGDDARRLARAVATLGGEGELRHAAAVAGLSPETASAAADTLVAAGILEDGRPLRMVHPLVRAVVAEDATPSDRATAHRRAFELLRADGATDEVVVPHALAAAATGDAELVALLRRVGERAFRTGTPDTAAVHLRRALEEPPGARERGDVLAALGVAEVRQGAFADGLGHLDQALALLDDAPARIAVHRDRAFAAFASAGMADARRVVGDALAEPGVAADEDAALQLEADLALLAWLSGGDHQLELRRHLGVAGETRAQRTMLALLAQAEHAAGAAPSVVVELAGRALGGGRLIAHDTSEALSWYMATYALLTCEAHQEARATIADALADGQRRGSAFARAGALGTRAVLALNEGRPRDAEADARTAALGAIPPIMVPVNASYVVLALVDQGELDAAEAELRAAGLEHGPGGPTVLRWIPWARARLHEAQGRADAVRADVVSLEEDERAGRPMRALAWRALLARALARGAAAGGAPASGGAAAGGAPASDDATAGGDADALAQEHLAWARVWGRPAALGVAQRAAALAAPAVERTQRAERLEEAVATLAGSSLRTEEARARLDLGVALLRGGRRRDGRDALEQALEVALACGARGTARSASAELQVAGAPPRRLAFDELTASERRVAEHAAAGRTNREIAEELFVTPKTVENHLTRVYAKLGVGSRRELAGAL
ncbi:ATP-binding protein [Conexibacter woesei]|uniref:Transcriptional regulator, LuxR family n=1 Tax=Conexibacter woesei (strain DSM 14684 / CCUG 47730 / CIP 108061 / JCM 11494 / NBRC 100937 / ID131577) TaxID=469383 RepID=D3FED4_CONWI|nr:LuxR family transcriptional regulator [Conexibacter woesei]ADB53626.1 transcriptional regulator, LuxR family [Conexibacter woesei DSM 14684]